MVCQEQPEFWEKAHPLELPEESQSFDDLKKSRGNVEARTVELCARLGYHDDFPPDGYPKPPTARSLLVKCRNYHEKLSEIVDDDDAMAKMTNAHPYAFPTERPIDEALAKRMAICGRRFEIAQLAITIEACACCGCRVPLACDPWYKNRTPYNHAQALVDTYQKENHPNSGRVTVQDYMEDKHHSFRKVSFDQKYQPAHFCSCMEKCGGGQWFSPSKGNETEWFKNNHDVDPDAEHMFDGLPMKRLCFFCHYDTPTVNKLPNL